MGLFQDITFQRENTKHLPNQSNEFSVVYSNPYGEFTLNLGDPYGLPDDMVEQISRFLACDIILINMKQFVRVGEIQEEINESRGTRTLKVQLTPATNRTMQNILGDAIYIANEEGNILSTEEVNLPCQLYNI